VLAKDDCVLHLPLLIVQEDTDLRLSQFRGQRSGRLLPVINEAHELLLVSERPRHANQLLRHRALLVAH